MKMLCHGKIFPGHTAGTTCELHVENIDAIANKWPGSAPHGGVGFDGDNDQAAAELYATACEILNN